MMWTNRIAVGSIGPSLNGVGSCGNDRFSGRSGPLMPLTAHPGRSALECFFLGDLHQDQKRDVLSHLLDECPACLETTSSFWTCNESARGGDRAAADALPRRRRKERVPGDAPPSSGPWDESIYTSVVEASRARVEGLDKRMAMERSEAKASFQTLLTQPPERRRILVANSRRYQTWATCETLLDAAFSERHNEPATALELTQLAVTVASGLEPSRYSPLLLADLRGRSWALLGNARRICSDYAGATEALRRARALLAQGTGSEIEQALVADVETSLHSALRRYNQALRSIGRSIAIYRRLGQAHLLGRALIQKGMVCGYAGDLESEVVLLRTGLPLVEPERDPRVAVSGWHNLCWALHSAGYQRQALRALASARPLYLRLGDRTALLRFQWLEGNIAASLGWDEQAEGCLRETAEGFVQLGVAHDAALATLDLAALLARQGRYSEVRELAAQMIAVFQSRRSQTDALAALVLLREAAERERMSDKLLRRIGNSLRHGRPAR